MLYDVAAEKIRPLTVGGIRIISEAVSRIMSTIYDKFVRSKPAFISDANLLIAAGYPVIKTQPTVHLGIK
jgi:hypothetical protein